ncbi:MAG: hypothetical protein JXR58_13480 [Bacteroidales bacterium]|nr:hypothetical protein [Bacteroidales bacterium]
MKNIIDIQFYSEDFLDKMIREIISFYELWSIRPLQNEKKVLCSGTSSHHELFTEFMKSHAEKEYPVDLLVYVGNGEKKYPLIMLNKTKKAIKVKFEHMQPGSIGTPLILPGYNNSEF